MRHHFGDMLNREYGHWTITPNVERWKYRFENLLDAPEDISILTITKKDIHWEKVLDLKNLRELTLHEPSKEQLQALPKLRNLINLRISHCRPKTLGFLHNQIFLKELILEYVSGFDDLSPISNLPKIKALHLENLRGVKCFSGLKNCVSLQYLSIYGTLDWNQPVQTLDFMSGLRSLEYFESAFVRYLAEFPVFRSIRDLQFLKKIKVTMNAVSLEDFAYLAANRPDVLGANRNPYELHGEKTHLITESDYRAAWPIKKFEQLTWSHITPDGERLIIEPPSAFLLGKGTRTLSGPKDKILPKCLAHEAKYNKLVQLHKET